MGTQAVALYRKPSYSPLQHLSNDTAIMDETSARLAAQGWKVMRVSEQDVEQGHIPSGELYLNMCQGSLASEQLMPLEEEGARIINRPSSVLNCHRHRLVHRLAGSPFSFPRTLILATSGDLPQPGTLDEIYSDHPTAWLKRGDVHAERPQDVVRTERRNLGRHLAAFAERGIPWAALQENVPGPTIKFYAVADGRFFRWYDSEGNAATTVDLDRLKALAFGAASLLGLEVFGGDAVLPDPEQPVLIDINDWPSFAPFRQDAARCIADYAHHEVKIVNPV